MGKNRSKVSDTWGPKTGKKRPILVEFFCPASVGRLRKRWTKETLFCRGSDKNNEGGFYVQSM